MKESNIKKYLVSEVKTLGGLCLNLVTPGFTGIPDKIIFFMGEVYLVELKKTNGRLSPRQKRVIEILAGHGFEVYVLYDKKEVDQFIKGVFENGR